MFDQTFVHTHARARRPWTIAASLGIQTLIVGTLLLVPILHPEILHPKLDVPLFVHVQPVHKAAPVQTAQGPAIVSHSTAPRVFVAPTVIPTGVRSINDVNLAPPDGFAIAGPSTGAGPGGGSLSDLILGVVMLPPPLVKTTAPPVKAPPPLTGPVEISKGVQAAKLIFGPKPVYPAPARAARVQGVVRIQAIIAADGAIGHLKVMSGPPLLMNAAMEAVARWRYQPTLLSGRPVEVITEIDVIFSLGQ
jgi:protein TonB